MIRFLPILVAIAFSFQFSFVAQARAEKCDVVKEAVKEVSKLRGLTERRSVRCKVQNKKEVEKYLRAALKEQIPLEKVRSEETVFKYLGIIPENYDYLEGLIELYTSQLGGYYDPKGKYYVMAAWIPQPMQLPIAVHELTHALQDQHFNLETFIDHESMTSDQLLARSALVEGDATVIMLDYSRKLSGQKRLEKEKKISKELVRSIIGGLMSNESSNPVSLKQILVFPYASGLNFAHSLLRKGGIRLVNKAFRRHPQTTEQILHPEKYLRIAADDFQEIESVAVPKEFRNYLVKQTYSDTLGEFIISVILGFGGGLGTATEASAGWAGDRVELWESKRGPDALALVWQTRWDSSRDSEQFLEALRLLFERRFSKKSVASGAGFSLKGSKYRKIEARRSENQVFLMMVP